MNESRLNEVGQLRAFLEGTVEVQFCALSNDVQRYSLVSAVLGRFGYAKLGRAHKGVVLRYLEHTTGYSRQQLTRLLRRFLEGHYLVPSGSIIRDVLIRVDPHALDKRCNSGIPPLGKAMRRWIRRQDDVQRYQSARPADPPDERGGA